MANYKHCSVIDANGYYVDFVLVVETDTVDDDGTIATEWVAQYYTPKEGETLVDTPRPHARSHAGDTGIVAYRWDGTQWIEGATEEELAQWVLEHPAPIIDTSPTEMEQLRADLDFVALMGGVSL